MRAVVVGAAGFIGSHLCRHLAAAGAEVLPVDRKPTPAGLQAGLSSPAACAAIADPGVDAAFLLGGTASVPGSFADPEGDLLANAGEHLRFLEEMRRRRPRARLVYMSSAAVYGDPQRLPITLATPPAPISPYGVSKLAGEHYTRLYGASHGLRTTIVRPFSVYGPGQRQLVVYELIDRVHKGPLVVEGSGAESRDFVHVDDLCRALTAVAGAAAEGGVYNVCTGVETSIAHLAAAICRLAGAPPPSFGGASRPGDPRSWRGESPELRALGWAPRVGLEDGLKGVLDWYRSLA